MDPMDDLKKAYQTSLIINLGIIFGLVFLYFPRYRNWKEWIKTP